MWCSARKEKFMNPEDVRVAEEKNLNNGISEKLISVEYEHEIADLIINKLIEKKCTLSNFEKISDNVQLYFKNNATVNYDH